MKIGAVTVGRAKHQPRRGEREYPSTSSQRGRVLAPTLARKCWVKKERVLSLRRRLARSEAESI
ncbi:MAG TPA: hypothetical protein VG488_02325 [Candidatus Angelobacter sp.]|nr:hypothetical protein [Candidatus Angelobacter sp.]